MYKKIFLVTLILLNWTYAMADWIFSNNKYQDKVNIEAFLMNKDQVCNFFTGAEKYEQQPYNQLINSELHIGIRIKNKGNKAIWGTIQCKIDERDIGEVNVPILGPNMKEFANFIIPIPGTLFLKKTKYPQISITWKKIYTK